MNCALCGEEFEHRYGCCKLCGNVFCRKCWPGGDYCSACKKVVAGREVIRVPKQPTNCEGCGGEKVDDVCTKCGPHDSARLTNRRRQNTTKKTATHPR